MKSINQLPAGYKHALTLNLVNDKKTMLWLNIFAIIVFVVMAVFMNMLVPISTMALNTQSALDFFIRFMTMGVGMYAYIILHELVHGLTMKYYGCEKVNYGFKGTFAYAGSDWYFYKNSYIIIALAPIVLLGLVLLILNVAVPVEWFWVIYLIQICNISGAVGDIYVTCLFYQLPSDTLIQDSGVEMKVFTNEIHYEE